VSAAFWRRLHFWAAIAWMFPGVLLAYVIVYHMPDPHASFAILVVSLYANTVSHWGAWQAARAEQGTEK
jgi:hypothetical protein